MIKMLSLLRFDHPFESFPSLSIDQSKDRRKTFLAMEIVKKMSSSVHEILAAVFCPHLIAMRPNSI